MNSEQNRFYSAIQAMEKEEDEVPFSAGLEDKLVRAVLAQQRADAQRRRRWVYATISFAMTACLALFMFLRSPTEPAPSYALTMVGDIAVLGPSQREEKLKLAEDSVLSITLKPLSPPAEGVKVFPFLRQGTSLRPWPTQFRRADNGVFQLRAPVQELPDLHVGSFELVFAIGTSRHAPTPEQLREALQKPSPATAGRWQVIHRSVEIEAR